MLSLRKQIFSSSSPSVSLRESLNFLKQATRGKISPDLTTIWSSCLAEDKMFAVRDDIFSGGTKEVLSLTNVIFV